MFSLIIGLTKFDIIPVDSLIEFFMSFTGTEEEDQASKGQNFEEMGYEDSNIINNLGIIFVGIVGLVIVIILIFVLKKLCFKCK